MAKFCTNCGAQVDPHSSICPICKNPLDVELYSQQPTDKEMFSIHLFLGILCICIGIPFLFLIFYSSAAIFIMLFCLGMGICNLRIYHSKPESYRQRYSEQWRKKRNKRLAKDAK